MLTLRPGILCRTLPLVLLTFLITSRIYSQGKLKIAVLDFEAKAGLTKEEAASLSDNLESEFVQSGEFVVVNRSNLKAVLAEQGFQQSEACAASECIVEVGKMIKAQKMFAGSVGTLGRQFNVTVRMIDVATAATTISRTESFGGDKEDLPTLVRRIAKDILFEMTGKEKYKPSSGISWIWYVGTAAVLGGGAAVYLLAPKKSEAAQTTEQSLPKAPGPPTP